MKDQETTTTHGWTRRQFLERVGQVGGAAALFETMSAMGFAKNVEEGQKVRLPQGIGNGKTVLILGAGVGGLTAAYDLERAGYTCKILEAQNRVGGRNHTVRRGDTIKEVNDQGETTVQTCIFDEVSGQPLYLNAGPGRIPYHHRRLIRYCKQLSVDLEIYVMNTGANRFQSDPAFGAESTLYRRIDNDMRGFISEYLSKAINRNCFNQELTEEDRVNFLDLLKRFGDLSNGNVYNGSTRSGCLYPETVFQQCLPETPLSFQSLLGSKYWSQITNFYQPQDFEWQPTLFQPVGGMDAVIHGFQAAISSPILTGAVVEQINLQGNQVEVCYQYEGESVCEVADYCISNIPLPILSRIPTNFSEDFQEAVDTVDFADTCKVGWQTENRFWETQDAIYGGISWINHNITQMWYPSYQYFTEKGTLTGAYNFSDRARSMAALPLEARLLLARSGAIRLHPEFRDPAVLDINKGLSIAWKQVPFQEGGWADWDNTKESHRVAYERLLAPDGRFFVVGDQVSPVPGWQEGAIMSANHVSEMISGIMPKRKDKVLSAPNARRMTEGW